MYVLALETATPPASFALADRDRVLKTYHQTPDDRAGESLLAQIDVALRGAGLAPQDLDVVGLTIGPGSFTGLRCGVAIAKILGYAIGCRIVALETMQVIAAGVEPQVGTIRVVMDAQRNGLFWQQYELRAGAPPIPIQEVQVSTIANFLSQLGPQEQLAGPGLVKLASSVSCDKRPAAAMMGPARPEVVAVLTQWAAASSHFCDPWTLAPKYNGRSAAEDKFPGGNDGDPVVRHT